MEIRKTLKRLLIVSSAAVILLVGLCGFFRVHRRADLLAYYGMWCECHPLWREFALRRINAGDSASALLEPYSPDRREVSGATEILTFYRRPVPKGSIFFGGGIFVSVKGNEIVSAESWGCTWHFTFF